MEMDKTFKPCIGLEQGTIFPELVSPYSPGDSMKEIEYLRKIKNDVIKYPNDANDEDIFIMFLFTPGHYDLLYDKK